MGRQDKVQQQYNKIADIYDKRWQTYTAKTLTELQQRMTLVGSESVLDVACGTGLLEQELIKRYQNITITGIDISEKMLEQARKKLEPYSRVRFQKGSAQRLEFEDESFDVVVSANSFHYFDDPHTSLQEIKRVVKRDGKIIILDWCRDFFFCRLCDWVLHYTDDAHSNCYTQAELSLLLEENGFDIQDEATFRWHYYWGFMVSTARPLR